MYLHFLCILIYILYRPELGNMTGKASIRSNSEEISDDASTTARPSGFFSIVIFRILWLICGVSNPDSLK